jgi:zinc/manganese transport system substrate-binding protein
MPSLRHLLACLAVWAIGLASASADEKIHISSFSTILTEIAEKVGGDRVEVTGHVKPGIDPHEFEPKAGDIRIVTNADLVLLSAKHMEGYVAKLKDTIGAKGRVVEVGDQRMPSLKLVERGNREVEDPHWWQSPKNVIIATEVVRDELIALRPADRALFAANANAYIDRLRTLDDWITVKVSELPRDKRKLVTNHDAFGYFARDYGFTVLPISGVSKNDEPGSKNVAELIAKIKETGVKAVFSEDVANPKVIQQITRETGAVFGGELYSDGLGTGDAGTIEGMFKHNVKTIVDALK